MVLRLMNADSVNTSTVILADVKQIERSEQMFIKAIYDGSECLINADYIVDIFNTDKLMADAYVLDIDREAYKITQAELKRLLKVRSE